MKESVITPQGHPAPTGSDVAAGAGTKLRYAAIIAALIVMVAAVAGLVPRWHQRELLRAETRDLAVPTVAVVSPSPGTPAPSLSLPAELKPFVEAPIYARASGYLKRYLVDMGAQVKAGELLAEIDAPELDQELAQARGQLAQAEAALALASTTAARWAELVKTSSVSEQEAAEKQADFTLKTATVVAARANVARLEQLQGFESVRAPFAGTVIARNTDVGQLISAGSSRELFRLAQTTTLRVYVRVPDTVAHGITPDQPAQLTVPALPGRVFSAKVVRTSGAMSADSRTLLTELEVDNPRGELLSGSYAEVRFTDLKLSSVLTLPSTCLLFRPEGPQVGILDAAGRVELRTLTLGRDFGPEVEVLSGLAASDRVIINPSDSLVSGTVVRLAGPSKAADGK